MSEPIPVIPSLSNTSAPILSKIEDIAAYLIGWYFTNPGRTSSFLDDDMISFRKLNSLHGNNPEQVVSATERMFNLALHRYDQNVGCTVTYEKKNKFDEDGILQGTYGIVIEIHDAKGNPIIPRCKISVDATKNLMHISSDVDYRRGA